MSVAERLNKLADLEKKYAIELDKEYHGYGNEAVRELIASISLESQKHAVADTGKGIPENDLPRIFDMFFSTNEKGIGLGLPFCKRVVEAHGGSIEVSSEVGVGTTFSIIIPVNPVYH